MATTILEPISIDALRQILITEQHREVGYDEAATIGESLISFYVVLAEDSETASENVYINQAAHV